MLLLLTADKYCAAVEARTGCSLLNQVTNRNSVACDNGKGDPSSPVRAQKVLKILNAPSYAPLVEGFFAASIRKRACSSQASSLRTA